MTDAATEIKAVGIASACGTRADVISRQMPATDKPWPWPLPANASSRYCRPARGIDPGLIGPERFAALARMALHDCLGQVRTAVDVPLVLGTCNGGAAGYSNEEWRQAFEPERILAGTPWAHASVPVVSAGCASGLHALFLAFAMLRTHEEVIVLAEDILSDTCHSNFESLRILAPSANTPWQNDTEGFLMGEAAVAVLLSRGGRGGFPISQPVLSQDLVGSDGLERVLTGSTRDPALIIGQGTGPVAVDRQELTALATTYDRLIPIATPIVDFGHTLGGSSLLSVALSCTGAKLSLSAHVTSDGRPIAREIPKGAEVTVSCRALGGACGFIETGTATVPAKIAEMGWQHVASDQPIATRAIRDLTATALSHRPQVPPGALIVWLAAPLLPAPNASRNGRLLPSAVVEMTPGFSAMSVAGAWGYTGPTLCMVGGCPPGDGGFDISGLEGEIAVVEVRPYGEPGDEHVALEWRTHAG